MNNVIRRKLSPLALNTNNNPYTKNVNILYL